MGSVSQVRMKPLCIPTKFECQSDRRKRTSNTTERLYILKKQRKTLVEVCITTYMSQKGHTIHLLVDRIVVNTAQTFRCSIL